MWKVDFPTLRKSKKQPTSILSGIYHLAFTSSLHASSCNTTYTNKSSIWLRFFYLDDFAFYNCVFYSPGNCLADTCALVKPSRKTCLRRSESVFFLTFHKIAFSDKNQVKRGNRHMWGNYGNIRQCCGGKYQPKRVKRWIVEKSWRIPEITEVWPKVLTRGNS